MTDNRDNLVRARHIVVKIGSASLVDGKGPKKKVFVNLAQQIHSLREKGCTVVLVTSGAVALGRMRLALPRPPKTTAQFQACAAAGQSWLMRVYEEVFAKHKIQVGQILLTHNNFAERETYLNARASLKALLDYHVLPVINENDTVAIDELRFGDNDQLAAMVITLIDADALVLLTDVDGVEDDQGRRVSTIHNIEQTKSWIRSGDSVLGRGGMVTKIQAALHAGRRGVPTIIASGQQKDVLLRIFEGQDVGSFVVPQARRLTSRKHWIAYTLKPRGVLVVDEGAKKAILEKNTSLLSAGVVGMQGQFTGGDMVLIHDQAGAAIACGLVRMDFATLNKMARLHTTEIKAQLGPHLKGVVVHRDDLVTLA